MEKGKLEIMKTQTQTQTQIEIENLKCGGCAATIKKGLLSIEGIEDIAINIEDSLVSVDATEKVLIAVKQKLSKLGYPEVGDKNTVLHKAKYF
ncbi:MAG: copper chaperone, partial [Polaribacter sp.]